MKLQQYFFWLASVPLTFYPVIVAKKVLLPLLFAAILACGTDDLTSSGSATGGQLPENPAPGEEWLNPRDGSLLVHVPASEYPMGNTNRNDPKTPEHRVHLSPFWIGKYEVTNTQYKRFLTANPQQQEPRLWHDARFNRKQQPVLSVTWQEASDYCTWAGLQLPSEAQWEAAARGPEGRRHPWGQVPSSQDLAVFSMPGHPMDPQPVASRPKGAGPFGTLDQIGNAREWCADVWNENAYQERLGQVIDDPVNTAGNPGIRVARGGSWAKDWRDLEGYARGHCGAAVRSQGIGFRCVLSGSALSSRSSR